MRLTHCDISHLVTFQFSSIQRLQLTFNEETQIIIGTNGSGKSHLLSQLGLLPPNRSEYEHDGYKVIEFDHNNKHYRLASDFSNKTSPHSFKQEDEELNTSGNTSVQMELLEEHVGFNKFTNMIVFNQLKITEMRQNERKTFFLEHNPSNVGFMLTIYKKINNKIRGLNTTLSILENRKVELEHEMLTSEEIEQYTKNKKEYETQLNYLITMIAKTETLLSSIDPNTSSISFDSVVQQILELRKSLNGDLYKFRNMEKANHKEVYNQYDKKLEVLQAKYDLLENNLKSINLDSIEIENKIKDIDDNSVMENHVLKITNIVKEIENIGDKTCINPLSMEILKDKETILTTLKSVLTLFIDIDIPLYSKIRRDRKHNFIRYYNHRVSELTRLCDDLNRDLDYLKSQIVNTPIPDHPCAKSLCPLYVNHINQQTHVKNEYDNKHKKYNFYKRRIDKYNNYINEQSSVLQRMESYLKQLSPLNDLRNQYPFLKEFINSDMLVTLTREPLSIYRKISHLISLSENTHRLNELLSLKKEEDLKYSNRSQLMNENVNRLNQSLSKLKDSKRDIEDQLDKINLEKIKVSSVLKDYREYEGYLARLTELNNMFNVVILDEKNKFERSQLNLLLRKLKIGKERINDKLAETTITLNRQSSLKERYEKEVVMQITRIDELKTKLGNIAKALNDIPIQNVVNFINKVFTIMNQYISIVFTYDFKLVLLDPSKEPDYKFKVNVNDVIVPDISLCSEAQKEMINLAFTLALRTFLKLEDYPIYLDECGRTFDTKHKQRLLTLLQYLLDNHLITQLFIVNHNALIHEGLVNAETLVLNDENILTPAVYNTHAVIN